MRARCAQARSAPAASRWRPGCTIWRCCRRSIPISPARCRSRAARSAAQAVVMVHYTRVQGLTDLPTEAAEVARAARDVGVRVGFRGGDAGLQSAGLRPVGTDPGRCRPCAKNRSAANSSGRRPRRRSSWRWSTRWQPRPRARHSTCNTGRRACSGARRSCSKQSPKHRQRTGRRVHMHLLETRYQRDWADGAYPEGIVRYLDRDRPA